MLPICCTPIMPVYFKLYIASLFHHSTFESKVKNNLLFHSAFYIPDVLRIKGICFDLKVVQVPLNTPSAILLVKKNLGDLAKSGTQQRCELHT